MGIQTRPQGRSVGANFVKKCTQACGAAVILDHHEKLVHRQPAIFDCLVGAKGVTIRSLGQTKTIACLPVPPMIWHADGQDPTPVDC
jgi:hypothetical protein